MPIGSQVYASAAVFEPPAASDWSYRQRRIPNYIQTLLRLIDQAHDVHVWLFRLDAQDPRSVGCGGVGLACGADLNYKSACSSWRAVEVTGFHVEG